jgi:16S rRNA (adenine1518-N6/adenine1519-N6)-dimethyltransferase
MNEMNLIDTKNTLHSIGVIPNKKWGQNFLINDLLLERITTLSDISPTDTIIEVGAGLGTLTESLAKYAGQVYAYEIDRKLFEFVHDKLSIYSNIEIINQDILNVKLPPCNKIISNFPYSMTGPLLEKLFYNSNPPTGVLIIEESIARRIFNPDTYKDFSRITITSRAFLKPVQKVKVKRTSFYPIPKIDVSVVKLSPREKLHPLLNSKEGINFFLKFAAGIMPYKNKDLHNALHLFLRNAQVTIPKENVRQFLKLNKILLQKLSHFSTDELIEISDLVFNHFFTNV